MYVCMFMMYDIVLLVCGDVDMMFWCRLAMKLLDKKRIKVKKGEYLALNERNMLAKVYTCTHKIM